ncbi:MAG TPA: 2-oxoacid:acceptor oxidoreductase family protein [Chloroflexota bacterium]|nr:2-oxoacid:acceptor oxidoreductase family protein [Chloroflexota bacterium]
MYRIRFHGRGGQGIKTASRVLGSALFREGFAVQDAPVYGAERRGAPMVGYVRAARSPIRERGVITKPDLVIVADDSLVSIPAANVLLGVSARTVLLMATPLPAEEWRERLKFDGSIIPLPPGDGASGEGLNGSVTSRCAGAAARLLGCISRDSLTKALRDELGALTPPARDAAVQHVLGAYDAVGASAGIVSEGEAISARSYAPPGWIDLSAEIARISAPDIRVPATSVESRTGAWRTVRPVIDRERCNRCTWICSTLCPDSAIRVTPGGEPEIDYDHCKGCLVCVAVCPPHAIDVVAEVTQGEIQR